MRCALSQMAGRVFANWWSKVGPYYTKAYQEMWVGIGLIGIFYYKLSYGGKCCTIKTSLQAAVTAHKRPMLTISWRFGHFRQKGCEEL